MNCKFASVLAAITLFGLGAACTAPTGEGEGSGRSSSASNRADGDDTKSSDTTRGVAARSEVDPDGGAGTTIEAKSGTVTIDGKSCVVDRTGLDMGLDLRGWTVHIHSDGCGVILADR